MIAADPARSRPFPPQSCRRTDLWPLPLPPALNTTPLIDVMLVLLIMFIITIPVTAHNMVVDLPGPPPKIDVPMNDDKNRLSITPPDQILWTTTK